MEKSIVIEEVYKTNDEIIKKRIIRQNLINKIKNIQENEIDLETQNESLQSLKYAVK